MLRLTARAKLLNSVAHRLVTYRPRSVLGDYHREFRISVMIDASRREPDGWLREENFEMNPLGEVNCPDCYRKDLQKRDRLWDFLLGRKRGV